jgi:hypothetical protein
MARLLASVLLALAGVGVRDPFSMLKPYVSMVLYCFCVIDSYRRAFFNVI